MSNQTKNATLVGGGGQSLNNQPLKNPKNAKGLDSKSKLESKNPNKIQTTKIQDSKIQLESNPKDLAKLESNSPKLKDSKVSKTSKDSMKLESSPKLDSKTSQKSNSKSKSPKIQKVKNTCDSKQSKKSKNSSKLKSFIRTIPISIALASALSSQAVADWSTDGGACSSGDFNCTISKDLNLTSTRGNIQIVATGKVGTLTIDSGYNVAKVLNSPFGDNGIFSIQGTAEGLTNNGTITAIGSWRNIVVGAENNTSASIGNIVNNGTMVSINTNMLLHGRVDSIVNSGTIILNSGTNQAWSSVFAIENQVGADLTFSDQSLTQSTTNYKNIIWTQDRRATSLGNIVAKDNARLEGNFDFKNRFTGESITFQDSASMTGNISLAGNSAITNGITIGGNSSGGSGNNASLTGNISLAGQSRISKILIDGSNMGGSGTNGTPKLQGNITLNTSNGITDGITITNGGTLAGNINAQSSSSIGGIAINNGSLAGNISLTNNARIQNGIVLDNSANMTGDISMQGNSRIDSIDIAGTLDGNVSAVWGNGGNGTINQMDISGVITQKVQLDNNSKISTLNLNGGTITGGINFQGLTTNSNGDTATIDNLTLNNDAHIGGIDIGNTSGGNAKGVISNLTLNNTASIGSIVNNRGTISELTLNNDSTITNGITNAVEGNIGTITSNTNNINNIITNEGTINELVVSKGTITYIDSSNSGVVDTLLQVENGATLKMGANGDGMITIGSDLGSVLDLKQGSTFEGNLRNASAIKKWDNLSNIQGSFINASGASVGDLIAGEIRDNLLNEGEITNLTINKNIGTLTNNGSGVINTLIIQDGSNIANGIINDASSTITTLTINDGANVTGGITNNSNIGSLNLQENVTYDGSGSITNALDISSTKTLTATNNGINILFANGATGTINNAGIISGNLNNQNGSTIKTFNTGSISGNLTNDARATIETLNVDSNVGSIANSGEINTLNVTGNVTNGITNDSNIANLNVNSNVTYAGAGSITNALDIDGAQTQFTISNGASNTLTLTDTAGANSVKTITNEGTIIGNLINTLSTDWIGGTLEGNFTNNSGATLQSLSNGTITGNLTNNGSIVSLDSGTIGGSLDNQAGGIINTLHSSVVENLSNAGVVKDFIVDSDMDYTGDGSITNSMTILNNNTLNIGNSPNNGTININFGASATGTIGNAGTINGNITNLDTSTIKNFTNESTGKIDGNIINGGIITSFTNSGSFNGDLTNKGNITNFINSGNFTGDIANSAGDTISNFNNQGNITGNITNEGIITDFNNAGNIDGTLTNANNANIGDFTNSGSIKEFNNEGLIAFYENSGTIGSFNNTGTIYGVLNSKVINGNFENVANALKNTGTISGNVELVGQRGTCNNSTICQLSGLWNEGTITGTFTNAANKTIDSVINGSNSEPNINAVLNNGIANSGTINQILNYSNGTINNGITNNANANIESITNQGTINGGITNSSQIGMIDNKGLITGNLTNNTTSSIITTINTGSITGSIANSGEITALNVTGNVNNGITNNANIGSLLVKESVSYKGTGSITNALEVAKDKTLTATNGITFHATKGNVNNLGTIAGNLLNVSKSTLDTFNNSGRLNGNITNDTDSTITNFTNSGTITGNLYNDGHIDTLTNTGTMGTIYNRSKNTIENLINDKNSVIAGIDNSNGRYDLIQNQGTILGDIKNNDGTITNLVNTNNGTITGNIDNNNGTITNLVNTNNGTITGNINNNDGTITKLENTNNGTITGQIISNGDSNIGTIINAGVINSSHTMNDSDIQNASNDAVSLNTITNVVTAISNSGSINGNVRVAGNSEVNLIQNSSTIAGCIILEGGKIGNINNTNGAIANCMSFSNGASVDNLNNSGTIKDKITNNSGNITVNNSGSIGGITTSNGGNTTIINGGMDKPGGNIGAITNTGSNSNTHIDGWTLDNPDNPSNPIIIADGSDKDGIHLKEDSIFVEGNLESGKIYNYYDYIQNEDKESIGQEFSQDDELFNALTFIPIFNPTDNGDGTFSVGLDTQELSGKTLGASLIYSSRMRQINTNSMLREINVKNFKTDFEILEQRERLKNQQALLENYKQQRESYLNELTKDNKELKRVSSKESTSLSTYANNSNIKSDAIEVVDYYNKDTLASLDNLQATTKANQETYSNLDLLRELDDIFISHTGDKDNLYTFALPYTRYTSAQLDGGVGTLKSHASGILAGAQAKLPSERGILGIYFGYESSDKQVGQQRLDFDEKVYYGGLTYYNVFARKGVSEYYLSANTRIDKGDTNLYKTYRSGSTTIDSQVDSYGYGADLKVGANYYNIYNNSVLSPEIGISYQGISTDTFRLRHLGGVSEHYYAQDVNFFDISASLRWQRAWNNVFKTMASLGAMYNVYNDAKGSGVIAGLKQSADINVEELYGTTQVGISYALGENANIALNYSGIFANGVQSHAGYIRLGVWW
ncbi:hypothetical protein [Helicobacter pullorum]|uniref:Autotransporter domain-containing protein n=1 Tax=Helicobacter pullorum TaxID=35818 RepID=A0A377Q188_9HELI|nr:hypothetical protein [Helicobacter pullorum]STQ88231.1 Uncharacterised protein [Helicobacter pullorum]